KKIEVLHTTPDGYKLVTFPRYRQFTTIFGYFEYTNMKVINIGNQTKITVDVLLDNSEKIPKMNKARFIYETKELKGPERLRHLTYEVEVKALKHFQDKVKRDNIDYIYE